MTISFDEKFLIPLSIRQSRPLKALPKSAQTNTPITNETPMRIVKVKSDGQIDPTYLRIRDTRLSNVKRALATRYFQDHIANIDLDLEKNRAIKQFDDFKVLKSAVRRVGDRSGLRYIAAIESTNANDRINYKKGLEERINNFRSYNKDVILMHDNFDGPDNAKTVDLIFQEFRESHQNWKASELAAAHEILEEYLFGKSIVLIRGRRTASKIKAQTRISAEIFINDIQIAASNLPQLSQAQILEYNLGKERTPDRFLNLAGLTIEVGAKNVHDAVNRIVPTPVRAIPDLTTRAALTVGQVLQMF